MPWDSWEGKISRAAKERKTNLVKEDEKEAKKDEGKEEVDRLARGKED